MYVHINKAYESHMTHLDKLKTYTPFALNKRDVYAGY